MKHLQILLSVLFILPLEAHSFFSNKYHKSYYELNEVEKNRADMCFTVSRASKSGVIMSFDKRIVIHLSGGFVRCDFGKQENLIRAELVIGGIVRESY